MADDFVKYDEKHRSMVIQHIFEKDTEQYKLQEQKLKWCQHLVDTDLKLYNEVTEQTLQVLDVQHVELVDGKVREISKVVAPVIENIPGEIDYEKLVSEHKEKVDNSIKEGRKTLVVNAYEGPGAEKTTASLAAVAELKKMGYVAEYVSEYAKELVYENPALLDGSEKNQYLLLMEQLQRMDRLIGKVDIIVTDAPILLNLIYGDGLSDEYKKMVPELYKQYDNFNFFVKRGVKYEQNGRMQDHTESIQKDEEIRKLLDEQGLYYGTYTHETSEKLAQKIQITYDRIYGEKSKSAETKPKAQKNKSQKEKPLYQGISYPKKVGKDKPEPVVVYGVSVENIITQMRLRNQQYEEGKKLSSCYIRTYNTESNKYENPEKIDLNTGKNISTIYLKLPHMKREEFLKLTQDIMTKGAKYDPFKKQFYITKSDDLTLFKDYLPKEISEPEKGQNESAMTVPEEQIIEMGEKAGLSSNDMRTVITIGINRGLTQNDISACLSDAIENGTSKDQIYELLLQGMNDKINEHKEAKKDSVLDALHENQKKIGAIGENEKEDIIKEKECTAPALEK